MVALTPQARELTKLAAEARALAERLSHMARSRTTTDTDDIGVVGASEACAYLDRLPVVPPKSAKRTIPGSLPSNVLRALRDNPAAWMTASAVKHALDMHDTGQRGTRRICDALASHVARGTAIRREVTGRSYDRYEYRIAKP